MKSLRRVARDEFKLISNNLSTQAFLASLSNRLYTAEASDRESTLISQNTILTLGHLGVSLKDVPKTTESVTQVRLSLGENQRLRVNEGKDAR